MGVKLIEKNLIRNKHLFIVFIILATLVLVSPTKILAICGTYDPATGNCVDASGNNINWSWQCAAPKNAYCCNDVFGCGLIPTPTPRPLGPTPTPIPSGGIRNPFDPPDNATFDALNPLQFGGGDTVAQTQPSAYVSQLQDPGSIISRALKFAFPLGGLILFLMIVWGGFEMMVGAPSGKSIDAGRQRVTAALVGFLILFASYWLMQIIEVVFGIAVL